ncbi:MAG: hypothetical protein L3J76_05185 [Candidatus Hydrothermae bacterium]|nr:hypothetical protein [Candidatus Hydrothermae bacterium]
MGILLFTWLLCSPPTAPPPRVEADDRLETYREVWTSWLRKNDLPLGDFDEFFEATHAPFRERKTYAEAPQLYARMQRWIPVAQYHDFFLYFLVKADLLFIGEKVAFAPGEPRPLFAFGCPRVRYTYRIREILFSTGRIPVKTGDTLDMYGTSLWTGYYEAYADSIDRAAMEASRARGDSIPPPPTSGTVPISLGCWTDLYTPFLGGDVMFLSPHPVSPALIAVRLFSHGEDTDCARKPHLHVRPPWNLSRFPGFWSTMPTLLAFRTEKGDTTFFFPLWRGWEWDRLTLREVRWVSRRFQEAYNRR